MLPDYRYEWYFQHLKCNIFENGTFFEYHSKLANQNIVNERNAQRLISMVFLKPRARIGVLTLSFIVNIERKTRKKAQRKLKVTKTK